MIKKFESFFEKDEDRDCKVILEYVAEDLIKNRPKEDFSKREFDKIESTISNMRIGRRKLSDEFNKVFYIDQDVKDKSKVYIELEDFRESVVFITIHKIIDEYFIVDFYISYRGNFIKEYLICDQIEGLESFMRYFKETIHRNFF